MPRCIAPLLLLFLLAAFAFCWRIADRPIDFDERYSLNIITGTGGETAGKRTFGTFPVRPIGGKIFTSADYWQRATYSNTINTALSDNGQGMPYALLLHGWFQRVEISALGARLPSAFFLLAAGALMAVFLRKRKVSPTVTFIALALLFFNGLLSDLARYIRFYTPGVLLAVLSWIALQTLVERRRAVDGLFLGGVWAAFFLNQYFAALVIVGQGIFLFSKERKKISPPALLAGVSGFGLLLLFWLFPLHGVEAIGSVFRYHEASAQSVKAWSPPLTLMGALVGLAADLATVFGAATPPQWSAKTAFNILLAIPGIVLCLRLLKKPLPSFQKACVQIAAVVLAAQMLFVIGHLLLTGKALLLVVRYWTFCIPFCAVWLALALENALQAKGFWRALAFVAITFLGLRMSLMLYSAFTGKTFNGPRPVCMEMAAYPDTEGLGKDLKQRWQPGDTVVYNSWKSAQQINWFLRDAPRIVQQVDTTQVEMVMLKTLFGLKQIPMRLGRPAAARNCQ